YVVGSTPSRDFRVVAPYQGTYGGGVTDSFIARLSPSGSIVSSTYYGGASTDAAAAVTIAHNGNVLVAGNTGSTDLPAIEPFQPVHGGLHDGFLVVFTADLQIITTASWFGGLGSEAFSGIEQLSDYTIVICGYTASQNPPPIDLNGTVDFFVLTLLP